MHPELWPAEIVQCCVALLGLAIGSFLTLLTYRLPRDEGGLLGRSRCPHCWHALGLRDLVPVLSWVLARGRCRHCGAAVSSRYPLIEIACAAGTLWIYALYGLHGVGLPLMLFWWSVLALIITDLEHRIILDTVQVAIALAGVGYGLLNGAEISDLIQGGLTGLAIGLALKYGFLFLRNLDALGWGDVKLMGALGLWITDPLQWVPFLFYAGMLGVATGLLWRALARGPQFPFGPSLALALMLQLVFPASTLYFWQHLRLLP